MLKSLAHILFLTVSANADLEEETASYQIPAITAIDEALTEYHPDFLDSDNAEQRYVINMPLQSPSCGQITPLSYAVVMSCQESYKFIPHTKKLVAKLLRMGANPFVFTHNDSVYDQKTSFEIVKEQYENMLGDTQYHPEAVATLQAVGLALVQYKILWNHLHRNWRLRKDITEHILTFVDFELDDYYI